ncbi:GRID1 [Mytilus edulis]|uniref:GRID1 n=1 Tax=Mytilus edulis TaxID=6550 RepID=A0A8S3QLA6_MYTED|nr:GRID1 [Mytilus edulis]
MSKITTSTECVLPRGNYLFREPVIQDVTGVAVSLMSVIVYLKWSSVCIIHDNETDYQATLLHQMLSAAGIFGNVQRMEQLTSQKIDELMSEKTATNDDTILNCTLLCSLKACQNYLAKPFDYGRKHVVRSSLIHNSRWLLGIVDNGDISVLETNYSTVLDNVAVIQYRTSVLNKPQHHTNKMDFRDTKDCAWLPIKTLMWEKEKRRWSTVGYLQHSGSLLTLTEIFPNSKMGFNKRKFLVGTLPHPVKDLSENIVISPTLNYCSSVFDADDQHGYEITQPLDGKWGAQMENGSWNGLIGQLERRDVDLVAAPVAVQISRENVVDFTIPYYYDAPAILLKKPDPNAKKWRTLIDPLSEYVILCIFIFLPVISLFLFFFEKCTPYYRRIENRDKVRGLHHFSDSLWYVYGALLTQGNYTFNEGGEHMAGSSSGRTLLSCWWIFCIIMMATYSGNLVAFLTVTKEKLPFSNIAGLVEQSSYKWGTHEGTVFETIFKTSTHPDNVKFWNGVVAYNKTNPSILSTDPNVQIRLVMEGDYAYVGDRTAMELAMDNNCHLAMVLSDLLAMHFAIALPNKSPFTKIFSDEMHAIFENGLLQKWKLEHWPKHGICDNIPRKESTPITLIDIHSSFYVVAFGVFIASSFLICECFKWRYQTKRLMQDKGKQTSHETDIAEGGMSDISSRLSELENIVKSQNSRIIQLEENVETFRQNNTQLGEIIEGQKEQLKSLERRGDQQRSDQQDNIVKQLTRDSRLLSANPGVTTVAFHARLSKPETPAKHHTIIFDLINTNSGNGYNKFFRSFTAPVDGIYVFSYTIVPQCNSYGAFELVSNNQIQGVVFPEAGSGCDYTGSSTVSVVELAQGDVTFVRTSPTYTPVGTIVSNNNMWTSFAGWRIGDRM